MTQWTVLQKPLWRGLGGGGWGARGCGDWHSFHSPPKTTNTDTNNKYTRMVN